MAVRLEVPNQGDQESVKVKDFPLSALDAPKWFSFVFWKALCKVKYFFYCGIKRDIERNQVRFSGLKNFCRT